MAGSDGGTGGLAGGPNPEKAMNGPIIEMSAWGAGVVTQMYLPYWSSGIKWAFPANGGGLAQV